MEAHCPEVSQGSEQRCWDNGWEQLLRLHASFRFCVNLVRLAMLLLKGNFSFGCVWTKFFGIFHLAFSWQGHYKTDQTSSLIVGGVSFLLVSLNGPGFPHI